MKTNKQKKAKLKADRVAFEKEKASFLKKSKRKKAKSKTEKNQDRAKAGVAPDKMGNKLKKRYELLLKKQGKKLDKMESKVVKRDLAANFTNSPFILECTTLLPAVATKYFSSNFASGVPRFDNGKKVYSSVDPAKIAEFEDAIEQIANANPLRDQILRSTLQPGANLHSSVTSTGTNREIFDKNSPKYSVTAQGALRKRNPTLYNSLKALPPSRPKKS